MVSLRKKVETVQRDVADGIDYSTGEILVTELIDKSMNLRRNLSENTHRAYGTAVKRILESDFSEIQVKNVWRSSVPNRHSIYRWCKLVVADILLLLGTGVRVSELYGLAKKGLDFTNRFIRVECQLCQFPTVTPYVLRHTFCTNLQQAGIDVKSLQYLMGHSNVSTTLDIYSHTNFDAVKESFSQAVANL